jgi:hypothetical protein
MRTVAAPSPLECSVRGEPLLWRRRCTSYAIDGPSTEGLPRPNVQMTALQFRRLMHDAFGAWRAVQCPDGSSFPLAAEQLVDFSSCEPRYEQIEGNVNAVMFRSAQEWQDAEEDPMALAITTVWKNARTGEIYDADMEINEGAGPFVRCDDLAGCEPGQVDLLGVMVHEVGHYFGVGHSPEFGSTMYFEAQTGTFPLRTLSEDDIEAVCTLYPEDETDDLCFYQPKNGLKLSCVEPAGLCTLGHGAPGGGFLAGMLLATGVALHRRKRNTVV